MDVASYRYSDSVVIAAPADKVWSRVTDVTRMGDVSPVCTGCEWDDPATGFAPGAWFSGHNDDGTRAWSTRCEIVDVVAERSFAFINHGGGDADLVRWSYALEPAEGGTRLTETWQLLPDYPDFIAGRGGDPEAIIEGRAQAAREGIPATLAALKAEIES